MMTSPRGMSVRLIAIYTLLSALGCISATIQVTAQSQLYRQPPPLSPDSLIGQLKTINAAVAGSSTGPPISNRAMNVYLSNKIGYYLSGNDDLTLYKNAVLINAAEGTVAILHSLYQPQAGDQRIRTFTTIGAQAGAADAFAATWSHRSYNNQFGVIAKQSWIAKGHVYYRSVSQKQTMDALRAGILHTLEGEIKKKTAAFEEALAAFDTSADIPRGNPDTPGSNPGVPGRNSDVPGQDIDTAKNIARWQFNADLRDEYNYTFARLQAEALAKRSDYRLIRLHWTSLSLYVPLLNENIPAPTLQDSFATRHAYPLHLNGSHTQLWESTRAGRLYLTIAIDLRLNNTYTNSVTPTLSGHFVYLPPTSHFGLSGALEQNFGPYHALNVILGLPIVLINKKAEPACNFELQVRLFDWAGSVRSDSETAAAMRGGYLPGKTSIGVTAGIPFSKIAF